MRINLFHILISFTYFFTSLHPPLIERFKELGYDVEKREIYMIFEFESTNFFLVVAIVIILFATILFFVVEKYKSKIKSLELEKEFLEASIAQNRENQALLKAEIENITSKIFEDNAKKSNQNINQILEPFKAQLNIFGNRVNEVFTEETKQRSSLLTEIKNLKELNNQISNDALNLTKALKGQNKIQGDWGENDFRIHFKSIRT